MLPHAAAVAVAVVIFTLIYDPFHAGAVAFLALTPITLVFTNPQVNCSVRRAAFCGFAFGLAAAMAIVGPWMYAASVDYFDRSRLWSFAFTLGINAVYVAMFQVPAFVALRILASAPPMLRVFGAASVWIAFEALRAAYPFGNTWALLGQGVGNLPLLREAAAYGGVWTLGWFAALSGCAIGVGLQPDVRPHDALRCTWIAVSAPVVLTLLGLLAHVGDQTHAPLQPLRVAVVQAEIASRDIWDPAQRLAHWEAYMAATASLRLGSVDLVVWPESAAPFLLDADASAREKLAELTTTLGAAILLGAPRTQPAGQGRAALLNSVYFFRPGSAEPVTYDKRRLLPFVESMPAAIAGEDVATEYSAGKSVAMFDVHGWQIAPLLCFEAVYSEYAREAVLGGAHLLVNLSNDAWFAGGAGPEQHYAMSVLRAVELRRPMVRASNGGVSGAVGTDGATIGFPIRRQKAVHVYEIPPPPRTITFAATHGDLVAWLAGLVAILSVAVALNSARRRA